MLATTLVITYFCTIATTVGLGKNLPREPISPPWAEPHLQPDRTHGHSATYWHGRFLQMRHLAYHRLLISRRRWRPTVDYALRLASAVSGVSYWSLRTVSYCESTHNPFATNGRYSGLFQLSWSPFGFSPFDPVANALSAALTVRHDGSWRQWSCQP